MKGANEVEITRACIEAEEMLTNVLSKLSFMAAYDLVSVRNIDVLRNRLFRTPSFLHQFVRLVKEDLSDPEVEGIDLEDFLENESVLLIKKPAELTGQTRFLNLSPFVIDENAYIKKADTIKLHYFHHFQEAAGIYFFKHTYKPEDPLLAIAHIDRSEDHDAEEVITQDIRDQFEDFRRMVRTAAPGISA